MTADFNICRPGNSKNFSESVALKTLLSIILPFLFIAVAAHSPARGQAECIYLSDWHDLFLSNTHLVAGPNQCCVRHDESEFPQNAKLLSRYALHDFYREKRGSEVYRRAVFWQQLNELYLPVRYKKMRFLVGAIHQMSNKEINYDNPPSESFHIINRTSAYALEVGASLWGDRIAADARIGRKNWQNGFFLPRSVGIKLQLFRALSCAYHHYRDGFVWNLNFRYREALVDLDWPQRGRLDDYEVNLALFQKLRLMARLQKNVISSDLNYREREKFFAPEGKQQRSALALELMPFSRLSCSFEYLQRDGEISGRFYERRESFGKLTSLSDFAETFDSKVTLKWNHHIVGTTFSWGKGRASGRGHIESWPFTSTWIDLLGVRYNFRTNLQFAFHRFGVNYQFAKRQWHLQSGWCFERLYPVGESRTWKPLFLVFGQRDLRINNLTLKEQDGIYAALRFDRDFGKLLSISYEFNQYIPLPSHEPSRTPSSGEPIPGPKVKRSIYGGGKHTVQLGINL